jgi:hypothetical protein
LRSSSILRKVITLTNKGPEISDDSAEHQRLVAAFRRQHFVRLPEIIEPRLLNLIWERIAQAKFYRLEHPHGAELETDDTSTEAWLGLLVNNSHLFDFIQAVTGCEPIGSFGGLSLPISAGRGSLRRMA